ncbi:hypothetical protein [Dongia sp.]|uniref:hypothetical protein n=1 Tax=Dongia sp. TaxID=1977262 RepID=UPI0035AE8982
MSKTKPSANPILHPKDARLLLEIVEIDQRGRVLFFARWGETATWLKNLEVPVDNALVVLEAPGRLSIRSWLPDGPRVLERYQELLSQEGDPELLRRILDRYQKIVIRSDRRPYLGDIALTHLGLPIRRQEPTALYAAIFPDRIDLLSVAYRNQELLVGDAQLDDLP